MPRCLTCGQQVEDYGELHAHRYGCPDRGETWQEPADPITADRDAPLVPKPVADGGEET